MVLLPSHLSLPSYRYRPRAAPGPRPFHSSDTQSYLHLHVLPCKKQLKGDLHLDSCSRPAGVYSGVRVTPGTVSKRVPWEYRLGSARWWRRSGAGGRPLRSPTPRGRRGHTPPFSLVCLGVTSLLECRRYLIVCIWVRYGS